ncbi:RNA polymerase sigma factor [Fredinandcohnia humi]
MNSSTFNDLYDNYFDDVYRYIYTKTGNRWDADDLVSETFRKAYEKINLVTSLTSPKAWLFTIARNTVIDFYRKRNKTFVVEEMEDYTKPLPFQDTLEEAEEINCLKKSLGVLPKEDLEIINLRYFSDLKFEDISKVLKLNNNSIRVRTRRIMKKVQVLVKKCIGDSET